MLTSNPQNKYQACFISWLKTHLSKHTSESQPISERSYFWKLTNEQKFHSSYKVFEGQSTSSPVFPEELHSILRHFTSTVKKH